MLVVTGVKGRRERRDKAMVIAMPYIKLMVYAILHKYIQEHALLDSS